MYALICEKLSDQVANGLTSMSTQASLSVSSFQTNVVTYINSVYELTSGVYVALRAKENKKYVTLVNRWYGGKNLQASKPQVDSKCELFQIIRNADTSFSLISV